AGTGARLRACRQLGARVWRAGAGRLEGGGIGAVREDVPRAVPRLTAPRPSGSIAAEPRWDVYYTVVFVACLAVVQAGPPDPPRRGIAPPALAAPGPRDLAPPRPPMKHGGGARPRGAPSPAP